MDIRTAIVAALLLAGCSPQKSEVVYYTSKSADRVEKLPRGWVCLSGDGKWTKPTKSAHGNFVECPPDRNMNIWQPGGYRHFGPPVNL